MSVVSASLPSTNSSSLPQSLTAAAVESEEHNHRLTTFWKSVIIALTIAGILVTMNQVFFWNLFNMAVLTNAFLYMLTACFVPIVFIVQPLRKATGGERPGVPWYDVLFLLAFMGCAGFFAFHGVDIAEFGWAFVSPASATVISYIFWALIVEVLRRTAGWIVAALALVVSLYPLVAGELPIGFLQGITYDINTLAQLHAMGSESILGLPLQTAGSVLVGFLLFGVVLQHTGGADFFHDLSLSLFGRYRGGSAKVAITSSAAMGMMSGSAVSNVLTTGPMTIPAMIKSGFSRKTAGAVEATASAGGSITPPIMGTAAFLMVSFVGVPYTQIIVAAAIPAFLYYLGIFLQVDGYAAMHGLKGTRKELLPRFITSLISGWPYIAALGLLTVMLFFAGSESQVPFWVVGLLLVIAIAKPQLKFGAVEVRDMILDAGKTLAQIIGIIAGVGLILGGLSATGVALSLSRDLIALVGESVILILIAGAIACFVLGMGLTISAAYVFLAIVMAPALTALGVDPIAAHLFVIYWASVSYITPPVGLAAFAAAGISKASPMGTCVEAMRLGAVKYVVPFGFALNPALVAQAGPSEILVSTLFSIVAVAAIACSFSGWLLVVETKLPVVLRVVLAVAGFVLFLPDTSYRFIAVAVIAAACAMAYLTRRSKGSGLPGSSSETAPGQARSTA
ncbi:MULTISPECIES: TRAP transporter permease [Glutamicibacter]|uniref:TRAP transporter permease n=1 Tax=Glutamicibacter TaxID=1742989 RepID=UPI000B2E4E57|nr:MULTISPECIES: TRAP transporter permease [Glutamicibacter]WIV43947.1 TRAP transporter permease [Glutamicibacter nicotianae]